MSDIVITVPIQTVFKEVARRSSVATETDPFYANKTTEDKQYSQLHGEGDRITKDFTKEAAKEVLKAYLSRQGDVIGTAYEYDRVVSATTGVKQKETITMTGTDGYAYITEIAPVDKIITFATDLETSCENFVIANADYYDNMLIDLTSSGATLIFESQIAGVPFSAPVVALNEGTLAGTTAHTTANQTVAEVTTGDIVYRFSENTNPLSVKQTTAIVERLTNNTRDAIVYYVLVSLYRTDGNQVKEAEVLKKALSLIDELSGDLYRLHD